MAQVIGGIAWMTRSGRQNSSAAGCSSFMGHQAASQSSSTFSSSSALIRWALKWGSISCRVEVLSEGVGVVEEGLDHGRSRLQLDFGLVGQLGKTMLPDLHWMVFQGAY